ncbi:cold shock domain-containing protein [Streptomyces vinaceus]
MKWCSAKNGSGFITQDAGGPDAFAHYAAISSSVLP